MSTTLDHLGFVGPQLDAMRAAFAALGFAPTEPKPLMGREPDTGAAVPLDQWSCHVVFERGYLELSAVTSRSADHHLASYGAGLQICAIGTPDVIAAHKRCRAADVRAGAAQWAAREIQYGKRHGEARFHWFMIDPADAPEGLLCYVEHATPELVYQSEVQQHPNGAQSLTLLGVVLPTTDALSAAAERYARILGVPGQRSTAGECEFRLAGGLIVLYTAGAARARFGEAARATTAAFAVVGVAVADRRAAAHQLAQHAVPFDTREELLIVPPVAACGAILCLHSPGRVF
ncbi:MAG TPA: VOC family protein [Steroidobacteraceae bacterium]|nr:VOC family protein [Steroidobacteraceae bacterium]HRX88407.1 VOC family protein [Steroidobacteraceae bacterium]